MIVKLIKVILAIWAITVGKGVVGKLASDKLHDIEGAMKSIVQELTA